MQGYVVTTYAGTMTTRFPCAGLHDVVDAITGTCGERWNVVEMVHDMLSGLEHVMRIDDVWITVTPLQH
jgi:ribosomal protein S5